MGKLPLIAAAILFITVGAARARHPTDPEQASFAKLSGKELVQQLADDKKRPRAFYELWRRAEPGKYPDFATFEVGHYNSRLVVCPQEKPHSPIYLVLYGFIGSTQPSPGDYAVEKPGELFPPATANSSLTPEKEPAIHAFAADGRVIAPFGRNNVLNGTLADINGDETIEHVESQECGVEGINHATVLTVSAVKMKAQPLLTVVLNWEADEWTYRLTDQDGDGISDIEAGPRTAAGLIPKAVWRWDRAKRLYVGPQGKADDHFRVINGATLWKDLGRLKATKLTFPKDPKAVSKYEIRPVSTVAPTPSPPPPAGPYQYASLKDAPNAELLRFMARGKSESDRDGRDRFRNRLPENFWTLDPKAATVALVEANRTAEHRAHYQIAIDDRDKAEPPPRCTIAFSDASARCYNAVDGHYFIRVDPDDSYLAFAGSSAAGVVFYNAVYDQPVFDMRICPLEYEQARKIAHVIWWLDRVRSRVVSTDSQSNSSGSSADGTAHLVVRVDDRAVIDQTKTRWYSLPGRWAADYTPETFVNFAGYLMAEALPESLGQTWSQFEPTEQRPSELRETSAPVYTDAERKRLQDFSERFLGWFSSTQERISFPIVSEAAQFVGSFGIVSDAPTLRDIEAVLPSPAPPKRSFDEVSAERDKLHYLFEVKDPKKRKRVEEQRAALNAEIDAILNEDVSGSPDILRQALSVSLRKLAVATDATRLSTVAVSKSDEQQWALQCLAQMDRKRYADALEALTQKTNGKWARQFFAELARVDRPRAATIARDLPPEKIDALTISGFLVLADSGVVPEETQRLATIVKILHNPKTDWEERARAIDVLVPQKEPLHYPGREVDEALVKLLDRDQVDENGTFTRDKACEVLALRGRTEYFDRIVAQFETTPEAHSYGHILEALTQLAQHDPKRFNPRLVTIVKPHLSNTNNSVPGLIWTIWSADLRELQPDIERLATRNAEEFEDNKAHSYGGSASAVTGRFHLARKIVSLWEEPEAYTRARLLIALAVTESNDFIETEHPERFARFKAEIDRLGGELSAEEKQKLSAFLDAMESSPTGSEALRDPAGIARKVTRLAREKL